MGKPSKQLLTFMETYQIDADEVWEVRAGGAWAVKHMALERVAAEQKITFEMPRDIEIDAKEKIAVILVVGRMGERAEWSFGEAAPYNNKNAYPFAMAEKRAKDRVILKLLNAHGSVYSEDEAEDFKRPNPHVTRPEDIGPVVEYDEQGEPVDNIPRGDASIERLPKAKAREDYRKAEQEMHATKSISELMAWAENNKHRVESFPDDWQEILRGRYIQHRDELRAVQKAAQ